MKETQIQMQGVAVSEMCRTYSFEVINVAGDSRHFNVEVSLNLFTQGMLKFQDGPLITREKVIGELARELTGAPADLQLQVAEIDILGYMARHYPRKTESWNRYKPAQPNQ